MGFLRTLWLAIKMRIAWFLLTAAVIGGAVLVFGPRSDKVDTLRRVLADRVLDEVIRDVERRVVAHEIRKRLAVLDFDGEHGRFMADLLRQRLRRKGLLVEQRPSALNKTLDRLGLAGTAQTAGDAAKIAREVGADAVVYGRVAEFSRDGNSGAVRIEVALADAGAAEDLSRDSYAAVWPAHVLDRITAFGAGWRLLIWLGVVVVVPLAAYPIARATLDRESNALTFLLLFALTALDLAVALLLLGFSVRTVWAALLVCGAFGGAGVYNYLVMNSYEKMRA
ncbi:MAG: hypothetical protein JW889_07920 [Verrucomicrobia bacterium]|nr:hypothetical protein [Verrucomicrobiota bacterium]